MIKIDLVQVIMKCNIENVLIRDYKSSKHYLIKDIEETENKLIIAKRHLDDVIAATTSTVDR